LKRVELIATAAFGLESQVAWEVKNLGYEDQMVEQGRVRFRGDLAAIARANLWLRCADRVQLVLGEFPARTFDELYDGVRAIAWGDLMPVDAGLPVDGKSVKSTLTSVPAIQSITKKAIVDALAAKYGVAQLPETGARHLVLVNVREDVATITLDTSGDGLHKRGYRDLVARAPLKETMAAGLVTLSRWRAGYPFADPLCGSGTIPIEAALFGLDIAPGFRRHFDAEAFGFIPERLWREARAEARDRMKNDRDLIVHGSDVDPAVIQLAERHARRAGVLDNVRFTVAPVATWAPEAEYGVIVTNPPYGERIGEEKEVERLYAEMGLAFGRAPTWSFHVMTAHEQFERFFGRVATKKRKLFNGKLRCDMYQFLGPRRPKIQP
jgi:putative N6-adenine-specific DNA methylase